MVPIPLLSYVYISTYEVLLYITKVHNVYFSRTKLEIFPIPKVVAKIRSRYFPMVINLIVLNLSRDNQTYRFYLRRRNFTCS